MQALSLAIGPAGLDYFTRQLVAGGMVRAFASLKPGDLQIPVGDFSYDGGSYRNEYSNILITLYSGYPENFSPAYDGIAQGAAGAFELTLEARSFDVHYNWHEAYHARECAYAGRNGWQCTHGDCTADYTYRPGFGCLTAHVPLGFVYDKADNTYDVVVTGRPSTRTDAPDARIPSGSILNNETSDCSGPHIDAATATAVTDIDFTHAAEDIFTPLIRTIAASGRLTDDITYDFAVGDSGLTFPGDKGLAIGVTGAVTYKGERYPGTPPAGLPVPPPPTDSHHLQLYVSNYELDALYWAFYEAGDLALTIRPEDLPDGDVLHCKTYVMVPGMAPYTAFAMDARIVPKQAPEISFQKVWVFDKAAQESLEAQLPTDVYKQLRGLEGNAYVSLAALETDLQDAKVGGQYWELIERLLYAPGMAVTQDLAFTLTILDGTPSQPTIVFDVARTDVLQNLGLGTSGSHAQTLTFDFVHATYATTFVSTTVPGFVGGELFDGFVWATIGEDSYDREVAKIGHAGAPLPIMEGFAFLFEQSELSIQEGYVSVLANVAYKAKTP